MALAAALMQEELPIARKRRCEIGLKGVSKTYRSEKGETRTVLSAVNLEIEAGEFVVVLGETGCGKSTLLRLILGEEPPSFGSIQVSGKPVKQIDARCGYVPQKYSLFPNRTALQNVMFGPRTAKYPLMPWLHPGFHAYRKELKTEATQQLLRMGLRAADANKYPHKMSGGMQQRVAIAQALIMKPSVMLMDEAFSALDPSTRISLQELVLDIWREQRPTMVFVTHNVAEALFLGTRLIVLGAYSEMMGGKTNVIADMHLQRSDLPYLERRHTKEFIELQSYVEELSYGISCQP
ncbi:NitT/TauT family transport system ATP-binding protein [Silvibacterium bohemicum]|uniref:NitT/TauT family transport system ATP-binding protein n=1 Tax=Silvibacterium bohemicum TaxID=1577686 RepID=A0A841JY65_9BACT|nr:ABC transporter ATP-binding protein [Silvibacterium bohemicum]MBB6143378.1 NitT/TauT family transport system ATP-binding protein [Silvibacterium bohemicum]